MNLRIISVNEYTAKELHNLPEYLLKTWLEAAHAATVRILKEVKLKMQISVFEEIMVRIFCQNSYFTDFSYDMTD